MGMIIVISLIMSGELPVYLGLNGGIDKWMDKNEIYNPFTPDFSLSLSTPYKGILFELDGGITIPVTDGSSWYKDVRVKDEYLGINEILQKDDFLIGIGIYRHRLTLEYRPIWDHNFTHKYEENRWGFGFQVGYVKKISKSLSIRQLLKYTYVDKFHEIDMARPGIEVGIVQLIASGRNYARYK
jgi:hypothetical protein